MRSLGDWRSSDGHSRGSSSGRKRNHSDISSSERSRRGKAVIVVTILHAHILQYGSSCTLCSCRMGTQRVRGHPT